MKNLDIPIQTAKKQQKTEGCGRKEGGRREYVAHRIKMRIIADFLSRKPRIMEWYLKSIERKNDQPRIPYTVKIPFKNEGEIKTFSNKN